MIAVGSHRLSVAECEGLDRSTRHWNLDTVHAAKQEVLTKCARVKEDL